MHAKRDDPNLLIRRWRSEYLVPDSHPLPAKVRERLDSAVSKDVPSVLAAQLQRTFRGADDELIFVRRLHLDFAVDTTWDADIIAVQCAQALTWRLARELSTGDASNVVRFSNRAEYLARFLVDRANGDAGSRWYYARFAGLHSLPCAAALRTALLAEIDDGFSALEILDDHDLNGVIAALGDIECRRIIDALAASRHAGDDAQAFATFVPLVDALAPSGVTCASQLALWWLARTELPDRSSATAALTIARTVIALRTDSDRRRMLSSALLDGNADAIASLAREDVETYLRLRDCPQNLLGQLLADKKELAPENESLGSTTFGGPFVLLDDLFSLPIEQATRGWPALKGESAATVVRFLVLCHCCGASQAHAMFSDLLWRRLFGVAPTALRLNDVVEWLASLGPRCRRRYRETFAGANKKPVNVVRCERYRLRVDEEDFWRTLDPTSTYATAGEETALGVDLDHLMPLAPLRGWSPLIALSAERVIRRFLHRLLGFSKSHLPYAQRNLLQFSASVEMQADRIVVLLGRPPLGMILNFAGSNRGERHWPSMDARPFVLFNS